MSIEMFDIGDNIISFRSRYGVPDNLYMDHFYFLCGDNGYFLLDFRYKIIGVDEL